MFRIVFLQSYPHFFHYISRDNPELFGLEGNTVVSPSWRLVSLVSLTFSGTLAAFKWLFISIFKICPEHLNMSSIKREENKKKNDLVVETTRAGIVGDFPVWRPSYRAHYSQLPCQGKSTRINKMHLCKPNKFQDSFLQRGDKLFKLVFKWFFFVISLKRIVQLKLNYFAVIIFQ